MIIPFVTFLVGIMSFVFLKKNSISMMISMEMMMLSSVMIVMSNTYFSNQTQMIFIFMAFMVTESATAISIVTKMTKNMGNQKILM